MTDPSHKPISDERHQERPPEGFDQEAVRSAADPEQGQFEEGNGRRVGDRGRRRPDDRLIEVLAEDARRRASIERALAFNGYDGLAGQSAIQIADCGGRLIDRPERHPDFEIERGIDAYVDGDRVDLFSDTCQITVDLPARSVGVAWTGAAVRTDQLVYGLIPLMARQGYYGLHAAALDDGDRGYLLSGDSGCGKSTSAVLAAIAGWTFVSDDFVYLSQVDAAITAIGLRDDICMRADMAELLPDIVSASGPLNGSHKYRLPSSQVFPDRVSGSCVPSVFVVPQLGGQTESWLEPVSRAEVLAQAIRQSGPFLVDPATVDERLGLLRRLIDRCECVRLNLGPDVLRDPQRLTSLLSTV